MRAPSSAAADRAAVERAGFPAFCEIAMRERHGKAFVKGKQMRLLAEQAERLFWGDILILLVSMPPGTMKSDILSRLWPAWLWIVDPSYRLMRASYAEPRAAQFASDTRALIWSDWFAARWGDPLLPLSCKLRPSGNGEYWTKENGFSLCSSIMQGKLVGAHASAILIDDPLKAQDAVTDLPKVLTKTRDWYEKVAITRGTIGREQRVLCAAQRFHVRDLNGLLISTYRDNPKFAHVMLPFHFEPERACPGDWRTREGEELFDDPKTRLAVASALVHGKTGSVYRSQYQQDPTDDAQAFFPPDTLLGFEGAPPFRETASVMSIDPTFAGGPRADDMAIDVWGYKDGHYWCYYSEAVKRDFRDACDAVKRVRSIWNVHHVLIEAAANGQAIYDTLTETIPGFERVVVKGSKEVRAYPVSGLGKSGRLHFDKSQPWWAAKARCLVAFPSSGVHDDTVDTMTQAVRWLREKYGGSEIFSDAMSAIQEDRGAETAHEADAQTLAGNMAAFAKARTLADELETRAALGAPAPTWGDVLGLGSMAISEFE